MKRKHFCLPVLMYHHVNTAGGSISVTPANFDRQLALLARLGYTAIDTRDLGDCLAGRAEMPRRPVMITMDDGWLDNWVHAYPLLKKHRMKAVIFIVTSHIVESGKRLRSDEGTPEPLPDHAGCMERIDAGDFAAVIMSWDEVREMKGSGLVDFQSHTHTHTRWDRVHEDRSERNSAMRGELRVSRETFSEKLGIEPHALCWPQGKFDQDYVSMAEEEGYSLMFTTKRGTNTEASSASRISRIMIGDIGALAFRKKMLINSKPWLSRLYHRISGHS